jgi:cell division protein DivIC
MKSSYGKQKPQGSYKGTRRRLRLLMVVVLCFMGWAAFTLWDQLDQVNAKTSELKMLESKLVETQAENEAYHKEIERLNDPEYIEQRIRKDLNMTKDGETLFIQTQ